MATVLLFPEGALGPTNNCVGIGQALRAAGHRVVFLVEESFAGTLEAWGFEERLMRLAPAPEVPEAPGQFWKDFVRDTSPEFRRSTVDQLDGFVEPTFRALCDGATYVDGRLREVLDELRPDVVVADNVVSFPAVVGRGLPWVRVMSCNPLELDDPALPPAFSGYPTDDPSGWREFRDRRQAVLGDLHAEFDQACRSLGAPPLPEGAFIHESPWLNLWLYPEQLDYRRSRPLAPTWHRLPACVRDVEDTVELPDALREGSRPLVYLSLGSLGGADVELMQHLVDCLADAPYRVLVSLGPRADELRLPDTMWGMEVVPQTRVLAMVDAVVTHGGNNTVTESLRFGRPMVALPLFWDQHDNAQRLDETGYGVRLPTYDVNRDQLVAALERLLQAQPLQRRLRATAQRVSARPGTAVAAGLIAGLADAS